MSAAYSLWSMKKFHFSSDCQLFRGGVLKLPDNYAYAPSVIVLLYQSVHDSQGQCVVTCHHSFGKELVI